MTQPSILFTLSRTRRAVLMLVTLVSSVLVIAAGPASAEDEGTITWAVSPADQDGPDGRSWVDLDVAPGESVTEHLAVRNLSSVAATFSLSAADGYFTDRGRFAMLSFSDTSTKSGQWVTVQDSVDVEAGGTAVVPFTVTVPDDASPGDHAAGIAASVLSVSQTRGGGQLGVESRVGFRVMTRVAGEVAPSVTITAVTGSYDTEWSPFSPGDMDLEVTIVNDGNLTMTVEGTAGAGGRSGSLSQADGAPVIELLPGETRVLSTRVDGVWPVGPVLVEAALTASLQGTDTQLPVNDTVRVWAIPWPQLASLVGVALLAYAVLADRRRRSAHLRGLLDAARAEGRLESASTTSSPVKEK